MPALPHDPNRTPQRLTGHQRAGPCTAVSKPRLAGHALHHLPWRTPHPKPATDLAIDGPTPQDGPCRAMPDQGNHPCGPCQPRPPNLNARPSHAAITERRHPVQTHVYRALPQRSPPVTRRPHHAGLTMPHAGAPCITRHGSPTQAKPGQPNRASPRLTKPTLQTTPTGPNLPSHARHTNHAVRSLPRVNALRHAWAS